MEEVHKKIKLTQWGSQILTSILTSQMMVTKNPQNVHRKYFWAILMTFISDIKIDINMCEPHYVNLFFLWTSSIVQMFDYLTFDIFLTTWHLFDNLTFWHMTNQPQSVTGLFLKYVNWWWLQGCLSTFQTKDHFGKSKKLQKECVKTPILGFNLRWAGV